MTERISFFKEKQKLQHIVVALNIASIISLIVCVRAGVGLFKMTHAGKGLNRLDE